MKIYINDKHKFSRLLVVSFCLAQLPPALASTVEEANKKPQLQQKMRNGSTNYNASHEDYLYTEQDAFADSNTYVGAEAGVISQMVKSSYNFEQDKGKNSYPSNPLLYGVFFGHKLNEDYGIEMYYERQNKKTRVINLGPGENAPGTTVTTIDRGEYQVYNTVVKSQHIQAAVNITLPDFFQKANINTWLQIGASYSQIMAQQKLVDGTDGFPGIIRPISEADKELVTRTFKQWKLLPIVKLGIHYNWTDNFGFRATMGWRHLGMLKPKSQEAPDSPTQIKLKDGFNLGLGFYFKL